MTNKHQAPKLNNLDMDARVYQLRRKVIDLIYEIKREVCPQLPRISVRVTETHPTIRGCARIGGHQIWITEQATRDKDLRTVVYHEVLHSIGVQHNANCPLMHPSANNVPKDVCQEVFKKYI